MTEENFVSNSLAGDVSVITLDDGKANALTFEVLDQLEAALDHSFDAAKSVVINGRPGKFSAGFDLKTMTASPTDAQRLLKAGAEFALRVYTAPIPVVLGITGHALAMGGILAVSADYRVGLTGPYKLGLNEVAIGMPVPRFGVELCRDRLSKRWLTRSVQHGHYFSPTEALDANFLDELVDDHDSVAPRALEVASHLAQTVHPGAFRLTRTNTRGDLATRLAEELERDLALFTVGQE